MTFRCVQGIMIRKLEPLSAAATRLREQDVVMEIDGTPIASDGNALITV